MVSLFKDELHANRVYSLANATLGVITRASLAVHTIGQGLGPARGTLTQHAVKQVDRLLSNTGVAVWELFAPWVAYGVAARTRIVAGALVLLARFLLGGGAHAHRGGDGLDGF